MTDNLKLTLEEFGALADSYMPPESKELSPQALLEIVADVEEMDLPDGAHMAMIEELTGMDAIDVYMAIDELEEENGQS